jgi:hypothetical protein
MNASKPYTADAILVPFKFDKFFTRKGQTILILQKQLSFRQVRVMSDETTGLGATTLIQVHNDGQ